MKVRFWRFLTTQLRLSLWPRLWSIHFGYTKLGCFLLKNYKNWAHFYKEKWFQKWKSKILKWKSFSEKCPYWGSVVRGPTDGNTCTNLKNEPYNQFRQGRSLFRGPWFRLVILSRDLLVLILLPWLLMTNIEFSIYLCENNLLYVHIYTATYLDFCKGQLISKGNFGVFKSTKKTC